MNEASRTFRSPALKCSGESTIPTWLAASGQDGHRDSLQCPEQMGSGPDPSALGPLPWKSPPQEGSSKNTHTRWAELRKSVAANGAELCLPLLPRP